MSIFARRLWNPTQLVATFRTIWGARPLFPRRPNCQFQKMGAGLIFKTDLRKEM
jgi:hypothetical protein